MTWTFVNSAGKTVTRLKSRYAWTCDCVRYGLEPQPDEIGECQTCYRPVYDTDGKRVTR